MEESLGDIIAKIEAKLIVIECMANVDLEMVRKNTIPLIQAIRKQDKIVSKYSIY